MNKILIVDDNAELRGNLSEVLKSGGYITVEAASGSEALSKAASEGFNVAILDLMMPKMSGIDVLTEFRRISPKTKIIMITAFATVENAVDAIKRGASDYISKPFKGEELLGVLARVLEEARFEEGIKRLSMDTTMSALANYIRRKIIRLLNDRRQMRLMELTREIGIEDHTKVIFHLKMLAEAGLIEQDAKKNYCLTAEGEKVLGCLKVFERNLIQQ